VLKQIRLPLHNLLHSFQVDTFDVYVVAVFCEETTEGGCVMVIPGNRVFGEEIAHNTFIVVFVVHGAVIAAVVQQRWIDIAVTKPIATIAGVVGRIRICRIFIGSLWVVSPIPAPPGTPPPWKAEVADKDDFIETVEVTKPMISMKLAVVGIVKAATT
jgi:hypothetical protein